MDTETLTQTWKLTWMSGFLKDSSAVTIDIKTYVFHYKLQTLHNKIELPCVCTLLTAVSQANATSSHL